MFIDEGLDLLPGGISVTLLRRCGNGPDRGPGHVDEGGVVGIEGFRHQNLIPIVQDTGHHDLQGLAAAVSRQDIIPLNGKTQADVIVPDASRNTSTPGDGA